MERAQARMRRRLARRFGPLGPQKLDDFLMAVNRAKLAHTSINNAALARLKGRRGLAARTAPRPRTPTAVRPTSPAPGEGPSPQGPPAQDEDGEDSGDAEPPPPSPRPRRARGRGRPRRARRFRAFPGSRTYRGRLQKLDAVAGALEGAKTAFFATLVPPTPPSEEDRRLAAVPQDLARAFAGFAARLRRAKVPFALVVATRADNGAFYPHGHLLVGGVSPDRLRTLAARSGLWVSYAELLQNPKAAARYMARAGQKAHWDGVFGSRGFYAYVPARAVSSRNNTAARAKAPGPAAPAPLEAPAGPAGEEAPRGVSSRNIPGEIPPGLEISPGIRIAEPTTFLAALTRDLQSPIPAVRAAARHRLALLRAALGGPP